MKRVKVSKKRLWQAIRSQCLACVCNSSQEIELCAAVKCSLYEFRFGRALKAGDLVYLPAGEYKKVS